MITGTRIYLIGNTYPVKDALQELGCKWDSEQRAWFCLDKGTATKARNVIAGKVVVDSTATPVTNTSKQRFTECDFCKLYQTGECVDCYEERKMGY